MPVLLQQIAVVGISTLLIVGIVFGQEKSDNDPPPSAGQLEKPTATEGKSAAPAKAKLVLPNMPEQKPQSAFGVVVDEAGVPIPDVKIQAASPRQGFYSSFSMPTGGDDIEGKTAVTDAKGQFRIDDIQPSFWQSDKNGKTPVMLKLRSPYRWRNDENYPLGESLKIVLRGSGKQGTLRMRLVDDASGKPITKFTVVKRHDSTTVETTNSAGEWERKGEFMRHRKYRVYCYASGYEALDPQLEAFDPQSDEHAVVRLKRRESLVVRLLDSETDKPIPAARMMAARLGSSRSPARYISWNDFDRYVDGYHSFNFVHHKQTDENGEADFCQLPEGESAFIVYTAGYQRRIVMPGERDQLPNDEGVLLINLKPESKVVGRLLNQGKPVAGGSVFIHSNVKLGGLDQMMESTKTDADGNYELVSLAPGKYWLRVAGRSNGVDIGTGVYKHDVSLQGTTLSGHTSRNGNVTAIPTFDTDYESVTAHSDENGKYELHGLSPGPHTIKTYSMDGGSRQRNSVEVEVKNVASMKLDIEPQAVPLRLKLGK